MRIDLELHLKLQTKNDKQGQGKKESNYLKPKTSNEACSYQDLKSNKIWVNRASSKATKLFFWSDQSNINQVGKHIHHARETQLNDNDQ